MSQLNKRETEKAEPKDNKKKDERIEIWRRGEERKKYDANEV